MDLNDPQEGDTLATGGDIVVSALVALGVTHVFGIVSVHNLPIADAIHRSSGIEWVATRHEQSAVHCADGYARSTGRLGVALVSTGPGTANAMGGLYEAAYASSPVLLITGQVDRAFYGRAVGFLHEADSQADMLRAVCRQVQTVRDHSSLGPTILAVGSDVLTGRPQPSAVEIPIDIQHATGPCPRLGITPPLRSLPSDVALDHAAERLRNARRPLIVAGGGAVAASASVPLTELAEFLDAPVLTSIEGRGAIDEDHPLSVGANTDMAAADILFAEADVVLAVGTRFQQATPVQRSLHFNGDLIHLDADASVIGRVHRPRLRLVGDARLGVEALVTRLRSGVADHAAAPDGEWAELGRTVRRTIDADTRAAMGSDLEMIMDAIASHSPADAVIVKDATISSFVWANRTLPVHLPRTSMRTTSMAIGPGLPLAIGAAVGSGRPTVVIQGDGGIMLTVAELATAAQTNVPLVVCLFNDGGYGVLRYMQDVAFSGRHTGVDLVTPDFVVLARAMGVRADRIRRADEFAEIFASAMRERTPWLLEIDLSELAPMKIVPQSPSTR